MTRTEPMLVSNPRAIRLDRHALAEAIDLIIECGETCTACADACLSEGDVAELATCIRVNMDCADVCNATARVLSRLNEDDGFVSRAMLDACALACWSCGEECGSHAAMHDHCRLCADACRQAERACRELSTAMRWTP
jgi:hypothetical protein